MSRGTLSLSILFALTTTATLAAQDGRGLDQVPKIRGVPVDTAAESARLAQLGPGAQVKAWRVAASIEHIFKMYRRELEAISGPPPDSVRPAVRGGTPVTYFIEYHEFEDECMEPAGGASAPAPGDVACQKWRRGKDKAKTLQRSRAVDESRRFIERATFTWFRQGSNGALERLRVELKDLGVSDNWKRHTPLAQLTIESVPVPPAEEQTEQQTAQQSDSGS